MSDTPSGGKPPTFFDLVEYMRSVAANTTPLDSPFEADAFEALRKYPFMGYDFHTDEKGPEISYFDAVVDEIVYENLTPNISPESIVSSYYNNNTDATDSQRFTNSKATSYTSAWSLSRGLSSSSGITKSISNTRGQSLGASAGGVLSGVTFSVNESETHGTTRSDTNTISKSVSLTDGSAQTQSATQSWSWDTSITIPARRKVTANVIVNVAKIRTRFSAMVKCRGKLLFGNKFPSVGINILPFFRNYVFPNGTDTGFKIVGGSDGRGDYIAFDLEGIFDGALGIAYYIDLQQYDADGHKIGAPEKLAPTSKDPS